MQIQGEKKTARDWAGGMLNPYGGDRSHHAITGLAALEATVGKGEGAGGCGHAGVQLRDWSRSVFWFGKKVWGNPASFLVLD